RDERRRRRCGDCADARWERSNVRIRRFGIAVGRRANRELRQSPAQLRRKFAPGPFLERHGNVWSASGGVELVGGKNGNFNRERREDSTSILRRVGSASVVNFDHKS